MRLRIKLFIGVGIFVAQIVQKVKILKLKLRNFHTDYYSSIFSCARQGVKAECTTIATEIVA